MKHLSWLDYPPVWLMLHMALGWMMADVWAPLGDWLLWPGRALIGVAIALAIWSALQFGRERTTLVPHREPQALVATGPYRFTRNPIYLADLMILAGWVLSLGSVAALLLLIPLQQVLLRRFVLPEEQRLAAQFGAEFDAYRARVRRWI